MPLSVVPVYNIIHCSTHIIFFPHHHTLFHTPLGRWQQRSLVLHVYEDNTQAVALYKANGYQVLSSDPGWKRLLPGARVRLLMEKQF